MSTTVESVNTSMDTLEPTKCPDIPSQIYVHILTGYFRIVLLSGEAYL